MAGEMCGAVLGRTRRCSSFLRVGVQRPPAIYFHDCPDLTKCAESRAARSNGASSSTIMTKSQWRCCLLSCPTVALVMYLGGSSMRVSALQTSSSLMILAPPPAAHHHRAGQAISLCDWDSAHIIILGLILPPLHSRPRLHSQLVPLPVTRASTTVVVSGGCHTPLEHIICLGAPRMVVPYITSWCA